MKEWIIEQIKYGSMMLGAFTAIGALEWITFTVLGLD